MAPISIADSFDQPLWDAVPSSEVSPCAYIPGSSSRAAEEPESCDALPYSYWDDAAKAILKDKRGDLNTHFLASYEPTRPIVTEDDVVAAATVYLNNPVNLALNAQFPGKVSVYNEMKKNTARADRVYTLPKKDVSPEDAACLNDIIFAVMDYKAVNVIRSSEVKRAQNAPSRYSTPNAASPFAGNLRILVKQAVRYAKAYQTRYVCFFDYNSLLLIFLKDANIEANEYGVAFGGETCQMTLVTDKKCMRRALLGFLARAYRARIDRALTADEVSAASQAPTAGQGRRTRA